MISELRRFYGNPLAETIEASLFLGPGEVSFRLRV